MLARLVAVTALAAAAPFAAAPFAEAADGAHACAMTRSAKVNFTSPGDTVTVASIPGPVSTADNCRDATVVFTLHSAEGVPMTAFAAAAIAASYDLGHTEAPVPPAKLGAFLDDWVKAEITTSDTAPEFGAEGVTSDLTKEDYDAIKAAKAPMLCYMQSAFDRACLAPDSSGYVVSFFTNEQT